MSIKKWVQLSDIHFGSPDNYSIETMRKHFLEKCHQIHEIDYLFLTGDFRYGKSHPDKYPDGTVNFLQNVQRNLGISPSNTFIVPGNHDIWHIDGLNATIDEVKNQYLPNRTIPNKYMPILDLSRKEFFNLYQQICGEAKTDNHFCIKKDDLNIIHVNTAVLCGKDGEDSKLFIDMLALSRSLENIDKNKPAIAIAHHPFDCLEDGEQEQLELLLKQFNTILFLCGHKHVMRCKNIHTMKPNINLWEFVCGTNMENPPNQEPAEIGFFTGYIDTELKSGYVEGHKWSKRHNDWIPNNEFSFLQNCANDGRIYFPERRTVGRIVIPELTAPQIGQPATKSKQSNDISSKSSSTKSDNVQPTSKPLTFPKSIALPKPAMPIYSFTDPRDGKVYRTVEIGNQVWMAKNLNFDCLMSKCYGNDSNNAEKYGRLYNWKTARQACPPGWHLPSDEEWQTLIHFAGGIEVDGKKLKTKNGWNNNGNGTDEFGFSALPGGYGYSDGYFGGIGDYGGWWSATKNNNDDPYIRGMYYYSGLHSYRNSGFNLLSVRCLQD